MRSTTPSARRSRRLAFLAVFSALLLLGLMQAGAALAVRVPFDGGPIAADTATSAANDHTVCAMRFTATAGGVNQLLPSTKYYIKVRFTTDTATGQPSSGNNRGFIWSGATWVQEADSDWTKFPSVTTSASGAITQSPWLYYKFGDTTKTGAYALIVSLSTGASGTTLNGTSWVNVNVFDPATAGGWVHDGVDNSASADKRADIVDHAAPGDPLALTFTEKNLVDDDSNGVVDDEQYGPVQSGGFRMAVPMSQALDVRMQKTVWSAEPSGFTLGVAGTDIALGAADQTAPDRVWPVEVEPRNGGAKLTWAEPSAIDGVVGYRIYRYVDAPAGSGYTAMPAQIAAVSGSRTYDDTGLANDTTYHYVIRAVDAATNVGPGSYPVSVTPDGTAPDPVTDLVAAPRDHGVLLSWTGPSVIDIGGYSVVRKVGSAPTDPTDGTVVCDGSYVTYSDSGLSNGITYYYAVFAYDKALNYSTAAVAHATPDGTPPGPVSGLSLSLSLDGTQYTLRWTDPVDLDFLHVKILRKVGSAASGMDDPDATVVFDGSGTSFAQGSGTVGEHVFYTVWACDVALNYSAARTVDAIRPLPTVQLGKPSAPTSVKKRKVFAVSGSLAPGHQAGVTSVWVRCYLLKDGKWRLKQTASTKNVTVNGGTRYGGKLALTVVGKWKLVAWYRGNADFPSAVSRPAYVRVK